MRGYGTGSACKGRDGKCRGVPRRIADGENRVDRLCCFPTNRYYRLYEKRDNHTREVSHQNWVKGKEKSDGKHILTKCEEKLAELIKTMKAEIAEMKKVAKNA